MSDQVGIYTSNISGNIPSEMGNLSKLQLLILGDMFLDGTIPSEIGNCVALGKKIPTLIIFDLMKLVLGSPTTPMFHYGYLFS